VELSRLAGDAEAATNAFNVLQLSYYSKGELEQTVALKEEALRNWDERVFPRRTISPLALASLACTNLGRWDEALGEARKALSLAEEYADESSISYALSTISISFTSKGDPDQGLNYGELAVQKAPTPLDKALSHAVLASARCRTGEPQKGIESLLSVVQMCKAQGNVSLNVSFLPMLAEGYLLAGDFDEAKQTAQEGVELTERCGAKWCQALACRLLGEIALETNPDEARLNLEKTIEITQEIKAENELALAYAGMGRYYKQQGNVQEARKYLTDALEIFERLGTLLEPDKARNELAELPEEP
jgi:tetratricopeptide (TPR) repeat protein